MSPRRRQRGVDEGKIAVDAALGECREGADDLERALGRGPSWSTATVLPALLMPDEHVAVKRTVFQREANWMAPSLTLPKVPNAEIYKRVRKMADELTRNFHETFSNGVVDAKSEQMKNLEAILKEAGWDFGKVVKCRILLADMADFGVVNEIYGKRFPVDPPARATFAVKGLPLGALVEIDCVAIRE